MLVDELMFGPTQWSFITSILLSIICGLLLTLILPAFSSRSQRTIKLPPIPGYRLPFIGHLHLLEADLRKPLRRLRKELGNVYRLQFGNRVCVVVSGFNAVREVLVTKGDLFLNRPYLPVLEKVTRGSGLVNSNGKKWKEHRMFTMSSLREFGMGRRQLTLKINGEVELLLEAMEAENGRPFNPKHIIQTNVANVICSVVFGSTFKHADPKFISLMAIFEDVMRHAALSAIINFLPGLERLPGDLFKLNKLMEHSDNWFSYVKDIITDHSDKHGDDSIDDYVSTYIDRLNVLESSGQSTTFGIDELSATIANLIAAGSQTITTTLLWSLALLATHPDIQNKLYEEIHDHVGTERLPTAQDKHQLVWVEAFYMEVMRFTNLTFGIMRAAACDTELHGYHIPCDAMVLVDMDSVLSDPTVWTDPDVFRPSRFVDGLGRLRKVDEFISFSLGKRKCIGEQLAQTELLLFLGAILQRFEIVCPTGVDLSITSIDGDFSAVHAPKPYEIICRKR